MKLVSLDTETFLITRGRAAPKLVCVTVCRSSSDQGTLHHVNTDAHDVVERLLHDRAVIIYGHNMAFDMAVICAQWSDLIDAVFAAYEAGRIRCTMTDQRLIDIADGKMSPKSRYSLAALSQRWLDTELAKGEDTWRLRYSELIDVPAAQWPSDATHYAIKDAVVTRAIAAKTYRRLRHTGGDPGFRAWANFCLYLMTCRGIVTDEASCLQLIAATENEIERAKQLCISVGLVEIDKKGKLKKKLKTARERFRTTLPADTRERLDSAIKATKAYSAKKEQETRRAVLLAHGLRHRDLHRAHKRLSELLSHENMSQAELQTAWGSLGYTWELYRDIRQLAVKPTPFKALGVKITKSGLLSVNADACRRSGDAALIALATLTAANTLLKKAQRMIEGSRGLPLQTSYVSPLQTGRTSSRSSDAPLIGDNFQNFRRSALHVEHDEETVELPGQRECIVARPGYVLCSVDLPNAEMRAHAQLAYDVLGYSVLKDTLNAGRNVHRALAADILGMSFEKFEEAYKAGDATAKLAAQFAKVPNFQMLGGGGWRSLPDYARGMGLELSDDRAKELGSAFGRMWREVKLHHEMLKESIHKVYIDNNKRIGMERYITKYTQACAPHQALTAVAALRGVCWAAREQYTSNGSLRGGYSILFLHDEIIYELPEDRASELAWRAARIQGGAASVSTPDCPMRPEPALMRRFSKGAETVVCPEGRKDSDGNPLLLVWEPTK